MRIESIREVKANLNKIVGALPAEGSVIITKNGRPCAVLTELVVIRQTRTPANSHSNAA
jgi:prevent-host-death family protein